MRKIDKIIIHCSATPEGRNITAEEINRWHIQRGFKKIGYHFVVYIDGTVVRGRNIDEIGAHCIGQNQNSIGICYIGGMDKDNKLAKDTRTSYQKSALRNLVSDLMRIYPDATLHGHNEFAKKACPSFEVEKDFWL